MSHSFQFSASVTNSKRLGEAYRVMESYPFSAPADSCVLFPKLDITIANLKTTSSLKIFCQNPFLVQFIHSFYTNGIQQTWLQWDQCVPYFPPSPLFSLFFFFNALERNTQNLAIRSLPWVTPFQLTWKVATSCSLFTFLMRSLSLYLCLSDKSYWITWSKKGCFFVLFCFKFARRKKKNLSLA